MDIDDAFWQCQLEGTELSARNELMPDREHEMIIEAALHSDVSVKVKDIPSRYSKTVVTVLEQQEDGCLSVTGGELWPASHILTELLLGGGRSEENIRGRSVLELGSGLGFLGLALGRAGAAQVTLSDVVPALLRNLRETVRVNEKRHGPFMDCKVIVKSLDWMQWDIDASTVDLAAHGDSLHQKIEFYDLIIGSELVYAPHHCVVADVLARLILDAPAANDKKDVSRVSGPPRGIIVQRADRPGWKYFLQKAVQRGLNVTVVPADVVVADHLDTSDGKFLLDMDLASYAVCELTIPPDNAPGELLCQSPKVLHAYRRRRNIDESIQLFKAKLCEAGFDLVIEGNTEWYNTWVRQRVLEQPKARQLQELPDLADMGRGSRMLLVANTKNLWNIFLRFIRHKLRGNDASHCTDHPLDEYTKRIVERCVEKCFSRVSDSEASTTRVETFFAYEYQPQERLVDFQKLASISGFCYHDEANSRLCIHPHFGPWFSLRALVILDEPFFHPLPVPRCGVSSDDNAKTNNSSMASELILSPYISTIPNTIPPEGLKNPLTKDEERDASFLFQKALENFDGGRNNEDDQNGEGVNLDENERPRDISWMQWVAIRDAVGGSFREHRFCDDQLQYHYSSPGALLRAVKAETAF